MLYWLESTLRALPGIIWVILGLGVPWAYVVLPSRDWRDYPLVVCLALALGPALLSVWMFVLGTLGGAGQQPLMNLTNTLAGTGVIAGAGITLALIRARGRSVSSPGRRQPLMQDERVIVTVITAGLVLIWLAAAYWPFIHYDPLWVYGYQGRLYTLRQYIPQDVGYYPQFLQMQYTFGQLFVDGRIDDHAARAIIPFLHVGSILAAYLLGQRLINRRTGIFAAGLWALYPHVGEWSSVGDLEIPLTFLFTTAAAFFLMAWMAAQRRDRWHYGGIAGLLLGVAMWTKPTAGAFIWGVVLLIALDFVRVRGQLRAWLPRFEVAAATGLACIPLGAVWYVRNILLGHPPLTLPHHSWLDLALRSGLEFGWPLLALTLLCLYLTFGPLNRRPDLRLLWLAFMMIWAALLPTIIAPRRIVLTEWLLLGAGLLALTLTLWPYLRDYATPLARRLIAVNSWAVALAFPYFVTWFYSYSYHYRLSFPIVPLMILPVATLLTCWLRPQWLLVWSGWKRQLYGLVILALCLPGFLAVLPRYNAGWDWLWSGRFPDDLSRVETFNGALVALVRKISGGIVTRQEVIMAPGYQRLPFFFPDMDVRIEEAPTRLSELEGVDLYVFTQEAAWLYAEEGHPNENQVTASMSRPNVMNPISRYWDSNYFVHLYYVYPPQRRLRPQRNIAAVEKTVMFGELAQLTATDLASTTLTLTEPVRLRWVWHPVTTTEQDYMVYLHLYDETGDLVATWDEPPVRTELNYNADPWVTYYSTRVWEPGEYIIERRWLTLPGGEYDPEQDYRLVIGLYDLNTLERLPVYVDGIPVGDGYTLAEGIRLSLH